MENLNTQNKLIFVAAFISLNIFCTWLIFAIDKLL